MISLVETYVLGAGAATPDFRPLLTSLALIIDGLVGNLFRATRHVSANMFEQGKTAFSVMHSPNRPCAGHFQFQGNNAWMLLPAPLGTRPYCYARPNPAFRDAHRDVARHADLITWADILQASRARIGTVRDTNLLA